MQVYKLYFKILRKQLRYILIYLAVFFGLAYVMVNQAEENEGNLYQPSSYAIAVFDEDDTALSRGLVSFLSEQNEVVEIPDEADRIQDDLYNRYVFGVVRIPEGFEKAFMENKTDAIPELTAIPGTIYGESIKNMINQYTCVARGYRIGGVPQSEIAEKTKEVCAMRVAVTVSGQDEKEDGMTKKTETMYFTFLYLPYIFISISVVGVGAILVVFNRKEVTERNQSSAYPFLRTKLELYAGMVTTGLAFCLVYVIMVAVGLQAGSAVFQTNGLLYCTNMICFTVVALGITFLIGQIVKQDQILNMAANVIGLGMSFLCGVFVPLDLLGDGVKIAAHFLPAYWYVVTAGQIRSYQTGSVPAEIWTGFGIQLLFGVALISAGIMWSRMRTTNAVFLLRDGTRRKTSR